MKKTFETRRPINHILPHIAGISAEVRQQYWAVSPWSAFPKSFRQH